MSNAQRVVIVEDDATVRLVVSEYLRGQGYRVDGFGDGASGLRAALQDPADVLIVDRMLPGVSGDELCRQVHEVLPTPILMLTALGKVADRIDGFEHGADDYMAKPFALRELHLRVEALLRRSAAPPVEAFEVGRFRVEPSRRKIWRKGREISLTSREYELFHFLLRNPDRVISRDELFQRVWGWGHGDPSTVTVHVRRLREKIEDDPRFPCYLRTEWGAGYRFTVGGDQGC